LLAALFLVADNSSLEGVGRYS